MIEEKKVEFRCTLCGNFFQEISVQKCEMRTGRVCWYCCKKCKHASFPIQFTNAIRCNFLSDT